MFLSHRQKDTFLRLACKWYRLVFCTLLASGSTRRRDASHFGFLEFQDVNHRLHAVECTIKLKEEC